MITISLRELVDDILLIVRNNNISESEDFSRGSIISWIKAYKSKLHKDRMDQLKEQAKQTTLSAEEIAENDFIKRIETGPLELEEVESNSDTPIFTRRTIDKLENVLNNAESSILAVHDQNGEVIQLTNHVKRHYQYFRKYTFGELTAYYKDDGHIYVQGVSDKGELKYIYVLALYEEPDDLDGDDDADDPDEDDVKIPGWMVPPIKELIMKNELSFMLNRPSDDSNNATLASVKPHGPQDDEE